MEVLGHDTTKTYGTIHYGNPHQQSQGHFALPSGGFAEEYHNYAVQWEPGKIKWYLDGELFFTETEWYSFTDGKGKVPYPAPFDQPFYIILNLAVGGDWPGSPDVTTDMDRAALWVDWVRVYQKDE